MSDADDLFDLADTWFLRVKDLPAATPVEIPARDLLRLTAAIFQDRERVEALVTRGSTATGTHDV